MGLALDFVMDSGGHWFTVALNLGSVTDAECTGSPFLLPFFYFALASSTSAEGASSTGPPPIDGGPAVPGATRTPTE